VLKLKGLTFVIVAHLGARPVLSWAARFDNCRRRHPYAPRGSIIFGLLKRMDAAAGFLELESCERSWPSGGIEIGSRATIFFYTPPHHQLTI